jgi:hypothetical protein
MDRLRKTENDRMTSKTIPFALAAAALLAGCAPATVDRAQIVLAEPAPAEAAAPRSIALEELTYAVLHGSDEPLILATTDAGKRMTLTPDTRPADAEAETERWVATDGTAFSFRGVQLAATDQLGADLMAVSQDPAEPGRAYHRAYHHSDDAGMRVTTVTCEMARPEPEEITILDMGYDTFRLDERCTGPGDLQFENAYWIGEDGMLWQSRQWVSAEAGTVELKRLLR